jgi:VanZ family protein
MSFRNRIDPLSIGLILLVLVISFLSLQPKDGPIEIEINDKLGHFLAYSALTLNAGLVFSKRAWVGVLIFGYSLMLESLQNFIPGRIFSIYDLIANTAGVLFGTTILAIFGSTILRICIKLKLTSRST